MKVLPSAMWGKKATAAVVAGAFLFTTVGEPMAQTNFWSDRQAARSRTANRSAVVAHNPLASIDWPKETLNPLLDNFKLPANLGSVVETHVAPSVGKTSQKTLIHIQDAHGIFDAQLNSAQILEGLRIAGWAGREGPITVYQEGGTGPADTDGLSSFPFADIREEVGRAFLRQKEITGEEYRALASSSGTFRLVGVETPDLYDRNLACRHDTVSARSTADRHISALQAGLDDIKRTVYSPSLLTLDAAIKDYDAHKIGFDEYIQAMTKTLYVREKDYPQLAAFVALLKTERELDSKALATERTILVQQLADRLSPEAVRDLTDRAAALRAGQTTHLEFYEALLSAVAAVQRPGETVPTYHLERYVRYLRQTEKIRHGLLLTESDALRDHALETLSGSDRVRQLVRLDRRLALEKLLWRQELTPDQYAALRKIDPMDWPATARFLSEQGAPAIPTDFAWTSAQEQVQAYYELAQNRDQALSSNALNEMDRTGVTRAVLIAGGFHTPGLTRLWRDQGINYVVVQPRFDLQESPPTPGELKISKDMLIARAQVRERLALGRDGVGAPLGQSVSSQLSFSMLGRAALENVLGSVGEKMKAQKEAAIQKLRPWMAENKIQIHSAAQTGDTAESATALVFGQKNGVPFVMAYQEGGNRFVVLDPKKLSKDVSGNYSAALTRQLEGLVTNQRLNWQGFVGALSAMKLNEAKSAFNETLAPFATRIVDFAAKSNEPLTPHAKEGEEIIQAAVEAAQKATIRAPSRIRNYLSGFLNKYFNRKTLTAGAALSVGSAGAMAAGTVAAAPGLGPILVVIGLLVATVAVAAGYRPALNAIKGAISPESTVSTTDQRKSALPLVAGLAAGGALFLLGLPLGITFLMTALSSSVVALLSPVFLIMNVMSGISFFMVALVVGYKLYFSEDYKDAKWAGVARVAAPVVGMAFTSGVLLAAMGALALWSLATDKDVRKIGGFKPLFTKMDASAEFLTKASSTLAAFNPSGSPPLVRMLIWAPLKAVHIVKDLGNTFKSFAFQSALDLYAIYEGTSTKNENTLSSAERGFQKTLNFLRGQSAPGSLRFALAQSAGMAALTVFYTQSVVARRMGLMVLSTIASFVGAQAVGAFVGVAVLGGGLGGIAMAAVFFYQAYRFYQSFGKERTGWIAGTNARMVVFALLGVAALATGGLAFLGTDAVTLLGNFYSFNPVELVGIDVNQLAQLAQATPHDHWLQFKLAAFNALSPSALLGSTLLGLLMTVKGIATQMQIAKQDPKSTLGTAARLFGWTKFALPVVVNLWNEKNLDKRNDFAKRVRSTVLGLQLVGPEVAAAVGVAAYAGGLNIGLAPVADVVNRIENTQDLSIMSLSDQLTQSVSASLFGEPGRINLHDYTIVGTGLTQQELINKARGLPSPESKPTRPAGTSNEKGFRGLMPMLLDLVIPSSHADEGQPQDVPTAGDPDDEKNIGAVDGYETQGVVSDDQEDPVIAGVQSPVVIDPQLVPDPFNLPVEKALNLARFSTQARVSRLDAMSARWFAEELRDNFLTGEFHFAVRQLREGKKVPGEMRDILNLVGSGTGGGNAYWLKGNAQDPWKTSTKTALQWQTEFIMNALIWDTDAKKSLEVRRLAEKMRDIMAELKEKHEIPRLVVDLYKDIAHAEKRIAAFDAALAELEASKGVLTEKARSLVENPDRARMNIGNLRIELESLRHKAIGERESAIKELKGEIPGLFPLGATIDDIQSAGRFSVDFEKDYLSPKEGKTASQLRLELAQTKVEMLRLAIPAGENYRVAASIAIDLVRAVAGQALGGVGIALGMAMRMTLNDPQRDALQTAGVWAYAQAVIEAEAIQEQEKVSGHIARGQSATQKTLVGMKQVTTERGKATLDEVRQRMEVGITPLKDYISSLKSATDSAVQQQLQSREYHRQRDIAAQYGPGLGLMPLRDYSMVPIDKLIEDANAGTLFGGPNKQLQTKFRELNAKDVEAMEPVNLGSDPLYLNLAQMVLGRSYSLRQARYLVAQREAELEAVAKAGDIKWSAYGGFFTSGRTGQNLSETLARQLEFRGGVTLTKTFDFSEALKIKEYSLQVDAANLNTQELTNRALRDLGLKLQMLESALARRDALYKTIEQLEARVALDKRGEDIFNIIQPTQRDQNQRALDQAREDLKTTDQIILDTEILIHKDIGKHSKDSIQFTNGFHARSIHTSLPYLRFEGYIDRVQDGEKVRDTLSKEGRALLKQTGEEIESARKIVAELKAFSKNESASSGGRASVIDPRLLEILELKVEDFAKARDRAEKNVEKSPKEVYKDLNDLSEKALSLVVFKTALSPEVKWRTPEGLRFDELVTEWDKNFRGRFDPFSSQRIALKNAEINQVRALIAGEMEPITINLDVLSFTTGGSGSVLSTLGKSNLANILSVGIPQKVWEEVGRALHPLAKAAGDGTFGQLVANLIPGYQSSQQREKSIEALLLLAQNELVIADQKNFDVQSNRESFIEQLQLARYIRDQLKERLDLRLKRTPLTASRYTTQRAETDLKIEDLRTYQEYLDMEKRVAELEIALLSLGVDTIDLPQTEVDERAPDWIGLSFGGKFFTETFEVKIAELRKKLAELELEAAKIGVGVSRIPVSGVVRKNDGRIDPGIMARLLSPNSVGLREHVEMKQAQLDKADLLLSQTNRDQAGRLQGDAKSLILSGLYLGMARDLYHKALQRMEVLAKANKMGGQEYNSLNRLTMQITKIWDNGGAGLEDAVYRIQVALGLNPSKLPTLNYAEARQKLRTALGMGLGQGVGAGPNISIHDPSGVTSAKIIMQRVPGTSELDSIWTPLLESTPEPGQVASVPEAAGLKEQLARLSAEKLQNLVIPTVDLSLFPTAKTGTRAELRFSWTVFGGGAKAREEIVALGLEKERELLTQKVQSYQDTIDQNRRDIVRGLKRIDQVNSEIQKLTQEGVAKKYHKDLINDEIQLGDVGSYQNQLIQLFAERTDILLTVALRYQTSRDVLGAFGIDIPLLEDVLDQAGVQRLKRNLYEEMEKSGSLLDTALMQPVQIQETLEWDLTVRTPARLHKPADGGLDQNPERVAPVYIDAFGERWRSPNTHLKFDGPTWFQSTTDDMAAEIKMSLGGQRILDRNDWAVFVRELVQRYKLPMTPEFMRNFSVAWQKVNREFKGYTDASEMPNSFAKYSEFLFKNLFPHHAPMTADYETNLQTDKNFHSKMGLALYYAAQMSVNGAEWMDANFPEDAAYVHLLNKERRSSKPLTDEEKNRLLRWKKEHSSEMDIILLDRQIPEKERLAFRRAAQVGLQRMFPEMGVWIDRLQSEAHAVRADGRPVNPRLSGLVALYGDVDLESLYSSLTALAISNGWTADELGRYLQFLGERITPHVGRYSRIATLRDSAQQPDAERLRFLLQGYQNRKNEAGKNWDSEEKALYKDVIDAERARMEMVYLLSTSMNRANAYFFAMQKSAGEVLGNPSLQKRVSDHFPGFMDRVIALRDMPEARTLILRQTKPAGGRIFWTQSDVQGILDALAQGWEASARQAQIDGAPYGERDVRAHVRNTLMVLDHPAVYRDGQKFFRGLGWPVPDNDGPREKTLFASRLASLMESYAGRPLHSVPGEWTTPEFTADQVIAILERLGRADGKIDQIKSEGDLTYLLQMADESRRKFGDKFGSLYDHRHRNSEDRSTAPELTDSYFLESRRNIPLYYDAAVADLFYGLTGISIQEAADIDWDRLSRELPSKSLGQPLAPWETPDQRVRMARFLVEGFDVRVNPRDASKTVRQEALKDQRIPFSIAESLAFDTLPKMGLTPEEWKERLQRGLLWQVQTMALSQDRWGSPVTMMGQGDLEGLITRAEQVGETDEKVQQLIWVQAEIRRRYEEMNQQLIAKGKPPLPALDETTVTGLASWVIGPLGKEKTDQVMGRLKDLSDFSPLTWLLSTLSHVFDWTKTDDRFMIYRLAREYEKNRGRPAVAWYLDVFFADATKVQEKIHELKTVSSEGYVPPFTLSMYLTLAQEKQAYMHWFNRVKGYEDKLAKERTNDPLFGELLDTDGKDKVEYRLSFLIGANIEHRILDKAGIKEKAEKLVETRDRAAKLYGMAKELITGFLVELSSRMDSWARGADRDFRDADDSFAPTEKFKEFLAAAGEKVSPLVERALADIPNRFARFEAKAARDKQAQQLNSDPKLQKEREERRPVLIKTGANAFAAEVVKAAEARGIFLDKDFAEMSLVYQESVAQGYSVADAVELSALQNDAQNRFRKAFNVGDKPLTTIQKGIIAGLSNAVFERWGALTRTGSETDLARYKEEVAKDQRDMDLTLQTAELLDRRINRDLFAENPVSQIQLRRIMVMASIALERGVVFYEGENKPNFSYVNDLFNSFSALKKAAIGAGLWPIDSENSGRLAHSLLLRLDRAMDVGLWDPLEDPVRSREDYGDAVHAAFESFRAGLGDVKRDPKGAERYANSRFSPEDLARLEKKVADTLFERQLPPAHVAILMERAQHMGEEIKKAGTYADENLFKDPEIALIGRAIQQPDPVTLLVLADKSYPDSVFSLDLADVLSDLLGKDGVKTERSSQKAIEMMNHASDQWAKTLRTAMLRGLREYLPKNRNLTGKPADSTPGTPPAVAPPTDPTKGTSLDQKTGSFSISNIPLLVGFVGLFSGNKKWAKWGIPIVLLGLMINPAMALAATLVDPALYAGVIAGIAGTLSGAATFSTTMTEIVVGNSGAIFATLFAAVTAYAIYIGMKDPVRTLFQKSKPKAPPAQATASQAKSKIKKHIVPILFGALTLAAIFMIMAFANSLLVNLDLLEQLKSLFNNYFALGAVQTPPFLGVERIVPSQWFEWSPLAGMTEWFGSGLFVGWLVSFGLSLVVGLLKGIWDRINYSRETHVEKPNPSIEGKVDHPTPDWINRGWAVASFWLIFPIFAAAAFGATAAISGAVSNLVLLALGLSGVVAIVNGFRDYLRRDKTGNEIKGPDQPWLFLTFRIFMFYVNSLTFFVVLCSLAAGDLTGFSALTATGVVLLEAYLITGSHLKFVAWLWAIQDWVLAFLFGDSSLKNNRLANPPKLADVVINQDGQGNAVADHVVLFENPTSQAGEAKQREILAGIRAKMIENPSMIVVVRIVNQGVGIQYAKRMEKYGQIIYDELFNHPDFNENNGAYINVKDGNKTLENVCRVIVPVREGGRLDKPWSYMLDMAAESALGSIWVDGEGKLYFGTKPSDSEGFPKFEGITVLDGPTIGDVKDKKVAEAQKLKPNSEGKIEWTDNEWEKFASEYRGDRPWPITSSFLVPGENGLEYSKQGVFDENVSWFYGVDPKRPKPANQEGGNPSYQELSLSRARGENKSVVAYRMVNDIDIRQPTGELATIVYEAEMDPEHAIFQPNVMNRGLESLRAVAESDAQFMLKHMQVLTGPLLLGDGRAGGKFLIAQEKYTDLMLAPKEAEDMELGAYLGLALRGSKPVRSSEDVDKSNKHYGNGWVVYAQTVMELSRPTILLGLSLVLGLVTGNFALGILFPVIYYFVILPQLIKLVPKSAKKLAGMPKLFASHDEAEGIVVAIRILVHSVTLDISRIADADDKALYYKWRAFFDHFTEWARMSGKVFFPVPARFFNNLVIRGNVGAALWLTVLALRLFATWSAGSYGVMLPLPALLLYGYLMFILLQDKITGAWLQHLWILIRAGISQAGEEAGEGVKSQRGRGLTAGIVGLSMLTFAFVVMGLVQGVWTGAIIAGIATAIFVLQKLVLLAGSDFGKKWWFVSRGPTVGAFSWLGAWVVFGMLNWAWAVTAFAFAYGIYFLVAAVKPRIYEMSGRKIHTDLDKVERADGQTPTTRYDGFLRTRPWNLNTLAVSALTPFTLVDYILNGVYEFGYTAVTLLSNLIHDFRYTRFGFHAVKNLLIKRIAPLWNNQPVDKLSLSVLDYFGFFRMPIITFLVFWAFASMNGALVSMGMPFLALSPTAFFILGTVAAVIFIKQYQFTTEPVFDEYKGKPGMSEDPYPEFYRYVGWGVVTLFVLLFFSPVIGEIIPSPAILFGSTLIVAMGVSALVNWFGGRVWPKALQDRAITVTQLMGLVLLIMVGSYYVFIEPVGPLVSVMETLFGAEWLPEFAYSDKIKDIFHQMPLFGIGAKRAMIPAFFSIDTLSNVLQAFPLIGIVHVFTAAGFLLFGTLGALSGIKSLGWDFVTLLRSSYPKSLNDYNDSVANFNKVKIGANSTLEQIEKARNQMLIKKRNAFRNVERAVFESSLVVLVVGVVFNPWIAVATVLFLGGRGLVEWNRMKNNVKGSSPWPLRILGLMVFLGLLVYAGSSIAAPVIAGGSDPSFIWSMIGNGLSVIIPLVFGYRLFVGVRRGWLEVAAKAYFDLLNKGQELKAENPPRAFLLLGNPFLQSVTDLAVKWKDGFQNVPIVLAGGIGAGTPGLLAAVKKQFEVDDQGIVKFLNQQSPELYSGRNFETDPMTEADLMRFTLMRNRVPSNMIRQETVPSSTLEENFRNTQEILQELASDGRVGVITGAPMRLRFGAVAATMKTKLDLPYEPVVINVGSQNLASMSDDELADLVQVRAGNNGGEVAWWANALGRDLSEAEQTLKQKLEFARDDVVEKLKQFNSRRVQKSIWDTSLNNVKHILKSGVEFGKKSVAFVSTISEKIFIKSWVKPVLIAALIATALYAGSALAAPVAGGKVVAAGTVTATGTSAMMGRLSTAALPAVFGLGLATAMGGAKTSAVGLSSPLNWILEPLQKLLRAGALLNVPVPGVETPKGHALFVDLRTGTSITSDGNVAVDPAVGQLFIAQLRSLEQRLSSSDTDKPVTVELVFNSNDFSSLGTPVPARVFQALLAQSNISKSLAEKIRFNVIVENQVADRLAALAPAMHLNVVAPADGAMAFWLEVGKQANVSLAILLAQLMSETDVTFTGEAAREMARRTGQEVNKDGTFTLKKALSPLESIGADQEKLVLFNKQA